jgi:GAF domain-containing protein
MSNPQKIARARFIFVFMVPIIIVVGLMLVIVFSFIKTQIRQQTQHRLLDLVSVAVHQIDGDLHADLIDPSQENTLDYQMLQSQLLEILKASSDVVNVYTLRIDGEKINYVLDSEMDLAKRHELGEIYSILDPQVQDKIKYLTSPNSSDRYFKKDQESVISGFAPIFTSDGKRDAILVMDIRYDEVLKLERSILSYLLGFFGLSIIISFFIGWQLSNYYYHPIKMLTEWVSHLIEGQANLPYEPIRDGEIENLGRSINLLNDKMLKTTNSLEQRVSLRTAELEQRTKYLESAAKVQHQLSLLPDPNQLMHHIVETIREQFGFYYVGLFLIDPTNTWIVLQAGTGKAGQLLLNRGQKVRFGEGLVGWVVANAESRVSLEVGQDAIKLSTPELPLTRSEAVLPLITRERRIGAISMHSDRSGSFDRLLLDVLQIMADQVAVILGNAQLYFELKNNYAQLQNSIQQISTQAWSEFINKRPVIGYQINPNGVTPINDRNSLARWSFSTSTIKVEIKGNELKVPIQSGGKIIGVVQARKPSDGRKMQSYWNKNEIQMVQDFIDQLTISLENARLYDISQRNAERERILANVTARVRTSTNVNTILQVAIQELADALHVPRGSIVLKPAQPDHSDKSGNEKDE